MPDRIPRICACGCGELTDGGSYISGHNRSASRALDKARRLPTNSTLWTKFKLTLKAHGNAVCQSIDESGYRCTHPVWGFHHIMPAEKYPDLAVHPENVVGVCLTCHNKIEAAPDRSRFVPTMYRPPMSQDPLPLILVMPGEKATKEQETELWTPANRRLRFAR